MMDFGGCRFDLDSRVHVASASVSLAAVVPLSVVDTSRSALASGGLSLGIMLVVFWDALLNCPHAKLL